MSLQIFKSIFARLKLPSAQVWTFTVSLFFYRLTIYFLKNEKTEENFKFISVLLYILVSEAYSEPYQTS